MTQNKKKVSREKKLLLNFSKLILEFLSGKSYSPLSFKELLFRLKVPEEHHTLFRQALKELAAQELIFLIDGKYQPKQDKGDVITGLLRVHRKGFAFLQEDDPKSFSQDAFIPKHLTKNAIDGDRVEVLVNEVIPEKGPEGKVIAITKRARTHVAGTICYVDRSGRSVAHVPMFGVSKEVVVLPSEEELQEGDRYIMKIVDWGTEKSDTICEVSHYLGHISDPSCDIAAAIEEHELSADFPDKVLKEALSLGKRVPLKAMKGRKDFRKTTCFTIDPDTAKDFDDALSLRKDRKGHYHLIVHIADVAHYAPQGSALDVEARKRGNSTYFPGYCLPMLPAELSENLCSLKPNVNRLTISVMMEFDKEGNLCDYDIVKGVIKSAKRFTYKEAMAIIDGKRQSKHKYTLKLMAKLCHLLKKKRSQRGCVEFSLPEARLIISPRGHPQKIEIIEYDLSHQLVEEFMIKANEVIATHLTNHGKNLAYRVHEEPSEENLKDFVQLAEAFGYKLSVPPKPNELQALFDEARQTSHGQFLATRFIRTMRLACYSPTNIGHYGLSLDYYCHFTSPIRRYADLIVHRQLFEENDPSDDLHTISDLCSEQERISSRAENSVLLLKKLRYLQKLTKKNRYKTFSAVVTSVKPFGFFFEIDNILLEGFLRVSELDDDYFVFNGKSMSLRGNYTQRSYQCGKKIEVILESVNLITLESKWQILVDPIPQKEKKKSHKKRKKRRK